MHKGCTQAIFIWPYLSKSSYLASSSTPVSLASYNKKAGVLPCCLPPPFCFSPWCLQYTPRVESMSKPWWFLLFSCITEGHWTFSAFSLVASPPCLIAEMFVVSCKSQAYWVVSNQPLIFWAIAKKICLSISFCIFFFQYHVIPGGESDSKPGSLLYNLSPLSQSCSGISAIKGANHPAHLAWEWTHFFSAWQ